jgi:hypothetical protein
MDMRSDLGARLQLTRITFVDRCNLNTLRLKRYSKLSIPR